MADEATISTAEEIAGQVEGSVATLENATPEAPTPKLVPERDLLAVKDKVQKKDDELKEARARIKELEERWTTKGSPELEDLKAKYQWVDADFLDDVAKLIEKKAEEKLAPVRNQQKQESFEKQWNALYNDQLAKAEWVDKSKVDPELIKALALSPQYRNTPIKELIEKLHKVEPTGRATTENDMRPAMDLVSDVIDADKEPTNEQKKRIFADPKARQKYFDAKYR